MTRHRSVPWLLVLILLGVLVAGCTQPSSDENEDDDGSGMDAEQEILDFYGALSEDRQLLFDTDYGAVRLLLYESLMPVTTGRIVELAESGFYDGTQIHRNVERFVIQGGDPTGTGVGGSLETIPHERHEDLLFGHGALGLARDVDEDSGDSQWFITVTPQPHLSDEDSETAQVFGTYTLFGQVIEGMDVVRQINQAETIPGLDRPVEPAVVESATVHEPDPSQEGLLGVVRTISDRTAVGQESVDVDRPLHLFAGHEAQVGVFLQTRDDGSPPAQVQLHYEAAIPSGAGETQSYNETFTLEPVDGDPWSFMGAVELPRAGSWQEHVRIGNEHAETELVGVHAWHEDYGPFAGDSR